MTPQQALAIIDSALRQISAPRDSHVQLVAALETLKNAIPQELATD